MWRRFLFLSMFVSLAACGGGGGGAAALEAEPMTLFVQALDEGVAGKSVPILVVVRRGNTPVRDYEGAVTFATEDPMAWHPGYYRFTKPDQGQRLFASGFVFPEGVHLLTVEGEGIDEPVRVGVSVKPGAGPRPGYVPPPAPPGSPKYFSLWGFVPSPIGDIAHVDVDDDGSIDVVHAGWGVAPQSWGGAWGPGTSGIWLGDGKGGFTKSPQEFLDNRGKLVKSADVDGDGDPDLALVGSDGLRIWLNRGDGTFDAGSLIGQAHRFTFGDVDGDGDEDLVIADSQLSFVVRANDGQGRYATVLQAQAMEYTNHPPALGDLDGDGDLDLFASRQVWRNDGTGRFVAVGQRFERNVSVVLLADMDADGDLDVVLGNYGEANDLYLNGGAGDLARSNGYETEPWCTTDLGAVDLDEDGDLDIVEVAATAEGFSYINEGDVFKTLDNLRVQAGGGAIRIADLNNDGREDFMMWPVTYRND
jgi:FG-GAP-like repeat